jgi:hypothetical protein
MIVRVWYYASASGSYGSLASDSVWYWYRVT